MSHARCPQHDVALGPDGSCVICRRSGGKPSVRPPSAGTGSRSTLRPVSIATPGTGVRTRVIAGVALGGLLALAGVYGTLQLMTPSGRAATRGQAGVTDEPLAEPPRGAPRDDEPARAEAPAREEPSRREIYAARREVEVTMYSTSWCGSCAAARSFLRANDIRYVEHDIEADSAARDRMHALNPRHSVPTFDVEGSVLVGFSEGSLLSALDRAARDHL